MEYNKAIFDRFMNERLAIIVETQQEWNDFTQLLESETDYMWWNGVIPTEFNDWSGKETVIGFGVERERVFFCSKIYSVTLDGWKVITYQELMGARAWDRLSEEDKEEVGQVLGNKSFSDGDWKDVFHKLGKGEEYDVFEKAYNEICKNLKEEN